MIKKETKKMLKLQQERDTIKALLKGTGLALVGWDSTDNFSVKDLKGNTHEISGSLVTLLEHYQKLLDQKTFK